VTVLPSPQSLGLSIPEWESLARLWSVPAYRGRQIFDAIHRRGVRSVRDIHEIPRDLRERLDREMPIALPAIVKSAASRDGSVKYGLKLEDGALIEAVYMPGDPGGATGLRIGSTSGGSGPRNLSHGPSFRIGDTARSF